MTMEHSECDSSSLGATREMDASVLGCGISDVSEKYVGSQNFVAFEIPRIGNSLISNYAICFVV